MFPVPTCTQHVSPLTADARDRGHGQADWNAGLPAPGGEPRSSPGSVGPCSGHFLVGAFHRWGELPFRELAGKGLVTLKVPPRG